jgi:D-alanyl-lipoteichoic acid acyltransferase DltB (MBOAT superfamily)
MVFREVYVLIIGGTIVVDYIAGRLIESAQGWKRKAFLSTSLVANIGVLAFYKYYKFIFENVDWLGNHLGFHSPLPWYDFVLPVGLSFHTFQAMSYTIEVYRGNQKAERNFLIFSLYVMFYPQMVAGPIERPQNLLYQFREKHYFDYEKFKSGLFLIMTGFIKKSVIADRLALLVNDTYGHIWYHHWWELVIAVVFFSFQIYCDFSGYTDIARGCARTMGFELMENFKQPYFASSVGEFWRKWHISLSTWFKDYLYIPLGGNRKGLLMSWRNLFIIFMVSGLWHGASWTFVIWGALHGSYVLLEQVRRKIFPKFRIPYLIGVLITFFLVTMAWIFFRAGSFMDAQEIISRMFTGYHADLHLPMILNHIEIVFGFVLIVLLLVKEKIWPENPVINSNQLYWFNFTMMALVIYFFGVFSSNQFIYFQF